MSKSDHTTDAPVNLAAERARLARAEAEYAGLKAARARGELPSRQAILAAVVAETFKAFDPDDGPMAA